MHKKLIPAQDCPRLIEKFNASAEKVEFNSKKNSLYFYNSEVKIGQIRLPIHWKSPDDMSQNRLEDTNYILLIIRSGIAAVGYFENGDNMDHKVFRAYMVRKKQGKSQIKHLNTKGKSRAGSRVRLAETLEFFENINSRLTKYINEFRVDKIGISYATTLVPYLFGSKVSTPFQKDDPRIFKIPTHISHPTYDSLLEVNDFLLKATVQYVDSLATLLDVPNDNSDKEEDLEDW
ncbi:hypothetical protein DN752_00565 [Echinicola strongylocentroti]|uniref:VLRF1 domain-containing protein n=1 Tax=Echinicola strongylocentroti TaxID=1795355 RepID=A0A2Z4IQS2_9BACT|nr:hypothetical protein [Echinicola strongylocentroti]AWW32998.1 hypothetical protein DN752_00565 [Echinicola strongylocentroti]